MAIGAGLLKGSQQIQKAFLTVPAIFARWLNHHQQDATMPHSSGACRSWNRLINTELRGPAKTTPFFNLRLKRHPHRWRECRSPEVACMLFAVEVAQRRPLVLQVQQRSNKLPAAHAISAAG